MTKEERLKKAQQLRDSGYNCATSVLGAFPDLTGLDQDTAARLTSALGAGIAGCGEICGAAVGMAIASGYRFGPAADQKGPSAKAARLLIERFAGDNAGCTRCAELKSRQMPGGVRSCNALVAQCVELLHDNLVDRKP